MAVMRGCRPSSGQIVNSFGQGKCTFNLKKNYDCAWQPCLSRLTYVENLETNQLDHLTFRWIFRAWVCFMHVQK